MQTFEPSQNYEVASFRTSKNQIELQIFKLYKIMWLQVLEPPKNQIELQILELYKIVRLQNLEPLYMNLTIIVQFKILF